MDEEKALRLALARGAEYAEIRFEEVLSRSVSLRSGELSASSKVERGYGVRVLLNGSWGFSFTTSDEGLERALERALKSATLSSSNVRLAEVKPVRDRVKSNMKVKPLDVSPEEVAELVEGIYGEVAGENRTVSAGCTGRSGVKRLITSEGTEIEWEVSSVEFNLSGVARENGRSAQAYDHYGSVERGLEAFEDVKERLRNGIEGQLKSALEGIEGPVKGEVPVILGPLFSGLIAHEALGHLAEADLTPGTPFKDLLGERIAPDFLSLSDGVVEDGFGNDRYDDEGVPVRKVEILKDGVLNELLVDRERAFEWGFAPNGRARAESYRHLPLIRMRNTYFEPGDASLEEMVEGIKQGYYLVRSSGGQTEFNSAFVVSASEAYLIENGEITKPVANLSASGVAIEALRGVSMVGKELGFENSYCGKGQIAFVSLGGPHMLFERGIRVG